MLSFKEFITESIDPDLIADIKYELSRHAIGKRVITDKNVSDVLEALKIKNAPDFRKVLGKKPYDSFRKAFVTYIASGKMSNALKSLEESTVKMPTASLLKKIDDFTYENSHTLAQMEIAKFIGETKLQKELLDIEKRHAASNDGISDKDYKRRNEIAKELSGKMSPEVKKKFHAVT